MLRSAKLAAAVLIGVIALSGCFIPVDPFNRTLIFLAPDVGETAEEFQIRVRQAFSLAQPGTILEFGPGTFEFTAGLLVGASHVSVRGAGINSTVLDFTDADAAEAILATGDEFLIRDIHILDPPGDGVKSVGVDGFTAQNVRVEWTSFRDPNNGPYGIYPVLSQNILIEGCHVIGAEDAGIYVGQSANALVRYNVVEKSVAGIEIENTIGAEVKWNYTTDNTSGILIFDLPGLSQAGRSTSVHHNFVIGNNGSNFGSGVVGLVPPGTGMLILATDDVEIYENLVIDHVTAGIAVVSYVITLLPFDPNSFDAWPETLHIHDNMLMDNGGNAQGTIGQVLELQFFPDPIPDVMWDGAIKPGTGGPPLGLPPLPLRFCQYDNMDQSGAPATFGVMASLPGIDRYDPGPYDCSHPAVPPITLRDPLPLPEAEQELTPEETAQLCGAQTAGVNWAAFEANCPNLSDYNLFVNNDPRGPAVERGLEYDLNTPLFSDYSTKYRFAFVPPGTSATFDPDFVFEFPEGTIITKTFAFDLPGGGEEVVETRLLIKRESGWRSLVYLWDDTFTEAIFTPEGAVVEVTFAHPDGNPRTIDYNVPDVNQCAGCHRGFDEPANLIGPRARNLNRLAPAGGVNQLIEWDTAGILSGLPDLATVDQLAVWDDPADGTVEERARAYLDSNCAHCHRPMGRAGFTSLWLTTDTPEGFNLGICKTPIAAGGGSGGLTYDILPGVPDESILAFRTDSAEPGVEMPEIAKAIVHDEGVALVRDWITGLQGSCP